MLAEGCRGGGEGGAAGGAGAESDGRGAGGGSTRGNSTAGWTAGSFSGRNATVGSPISSGAAVRIVGEGSASNSLSSTTIASVSSTKAKGPEVSGPTAHSACVSMSGVGSASRSGTVAGDGGSAGRRGRMHCSITTSSSPGVPSQTMSPLRRIVPPGSRGLSLTWTGRPDPASCTVTRPASTVTRAWWGLTVGRSRTRAASGAEPTVTAPLSGSAQRQPASGPPSTVSDAVFVSAIALSRQRPF